MLAEATPADKANAGDAPNAATKGSGGGGAGARGAAVPLRQRHRLGDEAALPLSSAQSVGVYSDEVTTTTIVIVTAVGISIWVVRIGGGWALPAGGRKSALIDEHNRATATSYGLRRRRSCAIAISVALRMR